MIRVSKTNGSSWLFLVSKFSFPDEYSHVFFDLFIFWDYSLLVTEILHVFPKNATLTFSIAF